MRAWLCTLVACGGGDAAVVPPDASEIDAPPMPSVACAGRDAQPADATWTVMVGSLARTAKVHVPPSYTPDTPMPLVINVHGRTHDATGQLTLSHAIAKADAAGFVVIHPEAWGTPRGTPGPAAIRRRRAGSTTSAS